MVFFRVICLAPPIDSDEGGRQQNGLICASVILTSPVWVLANIDPSVAKAGGLQSQGVKGEAVVSYRNPLTTLDLKSSGFPVV
mgnify:CR=1 FL=1